AAGTGARRAHAIGTRAVRGGWGRGDGGRPAPGHRGRRAHGRVAGAGGDSRPEDGCAPGGRAADGRNRGGSAGGGRGGAGPVRAETRPGGPDRRRRPGRGRKPGGAREDDGSRPGPRQGDVSVAPGPGRRAQAGAGGGGCGDRRPARRRDRIRRAGGAGPLRSREGPVSRIDALIALNPPLVLAVLALVTVQIMKFAITLIAHRRVDFQRLTGTGGMPSSHAASVAALATTVG